MLDIFVALGAALIITLRAMSERWRREGEQEIDVPYGPEAGLPELSG